MELFLQITIVVFLFGISAFLFCWYNKKPTKHSIQGRHVVVTGGSSGIGLWVATYCVQLGAHVTILARDQIKLEKALNLVSHHRINESQKIRIKSVDVSNTYESVSESLSAVESESGSIYMLVNCAGKAICGTVEKVTVEDAHQMMNINYWGTYNPTRYVLGKMKKSREGIIVITASQASLVGIYGYGPYAAAKFALRGLAETISMEMSHISGISVTLALPADTDTPGFEEEDKTKPKVTKVISSSGGLASPQDVAKQILDDALAGEFISILGFESWLATLACAGLAPWFNWSVILLSTFILGPLKLITTGITMNFRRIVLSCSREPDADDSF